MYKDLEPQNKWQTMSQHWTWFVNMDGKWKKEKKVRKCLKLRAIKKIINIKRKNCYLIVNKWYFPGNFYQKKEMVKSLKLVFFHYNWVYIRNLFF